MLEFLRILTQAWNILSISVVHLWFIEAKHIIPIQITKHWLIANIVTACYISGRGRQGWYIAWRPAKTWQTGRNECET